MAHRRRRSPRDQKLLNQRAGQQSELERQADELLKGAPAGSGRGHTPAGWLPRNQRPGYVSDYRTETRTTLGYTFQDQPGLE
jgi:hypothetical protein